FAIGVGVIPNECFQVGLHACFRCCRSTEQVLLLFGKGQPGHPAWPFFNQAVVAHVRVDVKMMIEVHGMRLGGSCGNIENQQTSWIEQRRQECELPRKVGQMFENVERENAVEAMLPDSSG